MYSNIGNLLKSGLSPNAIANGVRALAERIPPEKNSEEGAAADLYNMLKKLDESAKEDNSRWSKNTMHHLRTTFTDGTFKPNEWRMEWMGDNTIYVRWIPERVDGYLRDLGDEDLTFLRENIFPTLKSSEDA